MSWVLAMGALPEGDETEDLFGLLALADVGVGIAEGPALGVLCEEGEDTGLAAAAGGDIVLLEHRVVPVVGDGMEIEVEGIAAEEVLALDELMPGSEEACVLGRVDSGRVLGEEALLGDGIQSCKQGQSFVGHQGHNVAPALDAPEFECETS